MTDAAIRVKALEWKESVGVWTAKLADFSYVISVHDDENNVEFYRLCASVFPFPKTIGKYPSLTDAQREAQRRVGECVEEELNDD